MGIPRNQLRDLKGVHLYRVAQIHLNRPRSKRVLKKKRKGVLTMKNDGIQRAATCLRQSFGDWSMEQDFAWTPRKTNRFNNHLCKSRGSSTASNDAVASPRLAVAYRENHK